MNCTHHDDTGQFIYFQHIRGTGGEDYIQCTKCSQRWVHTKDEQDCEKCDVKKSQAEGVAKKFIAAIREAGYDLEINENTPSDGLINAYIERAVGILEEKQDRRWKALLEYLSAEVFPESQRTSVFMQKREDLRKL